MLIGVFWFTLPPPRSAVLHADTQNTGNTGLAAGRDARRRPRHSGTYGHISAHPTYPNLERNNMSTIATSSGLQYEELQLGSGDEAKAGNHVSVHYTGWLQNPDGSGGRQFYSQKNQ